MFGNGFYNPYMYQPYYQAANMTRNLSGLANAGASSATRNGISVAAGSSAAGRGLASLGKGLLGRLSFSGFLDGANKTLNVVNQAIPIFYQVRPIFNNAKTMFRIMSAVKDDDSKPSISNQESKTNNNVSYSDSNNTIRQMPTRNLTSSTNDNTTSNKENPVFFI